MTKINVVERDKEEREWAEGEREEATEQMRQCVCLSSTQVRLTIAILQTTEQSNIGAI